MNNLNLLIENLCPKGVKFIPLKDAAKMQRGTAITKKDIKDGPFPVVAGGQKPAYYCDSYNRDGETITVAGSGAYAGYIAYWNEPIFVSDAFSIKGNSNACTRYLFYVLQNLQEKIYATKKGGGIPHVHIVSIENFRIPLPPLPVQREIVRILDNFTELTAELTAELAARRKQYEHYRDELLTFGDDVPKVPLRELFNTQNGYTPSKAKPEFWSNGTIPWFRMEDIRENGRILDQAIQTVSLKAIKGKPFPVNSIIVATSATIGEHALVTVESLANQRFTYLMLKDEYKERVNIKFLFYYCFLLDEYCLSCLNQGNFASVDMVKFGKFLFSIPPIEEQNYIVDQLDRFDTLCNDLTSGLPAEIAARQKQYEYYRGKLLTFKELEG